MFFEICFVSIVGAQANGLPPKQLTSWNCFTLCFFYIWTLYSRVDAYWYFWRYKIDKFRRSFTQSGPNWSRPKLGRPKVRKNVEKSTSQLFHISWISGNPSISHSLGFASHNWISTRFTGKLLTSRYFSVSFKSSGKYNWFIYMSKIGQFVTTHLGKKFKQNLG